MTFPILGGNGAVSGFSIDNSLRFNDDDNAYLSKTLSASPTNQKIVSFSFWAKRGNLGVYSYNLVGNTSAPYVVIGFLNDDTFSFQLNAGSGSTGLITTAKYRDISAWYHMLCVLDTTQATSSNRLKIYINGIQITDFGTANYPAQDSTWNINTNVEHGIGGSSAIQDFDGYMAEVHFIDGQALSPTDFGEFDEDSGIWKPIRYSGSYGTNGFYLDFENSGSLGADSSGNGNNFTPTNLASTDQTTDTPTNNFCTLNSIYRNGASSNIAPTYSEGNTITNSGGSGTSGTRTSSTFEFSSGKWYWEVKVNDSPSAVDIGINNNAIGALCGIRQDGTYFTDNNNQGTLTSFTSGDIISFAFDMDNKKMYIAKNGTYMNSANPSTSTNGISFTTTDSMHCQFKSRQDDSLSANFGNPPFSITSGNSDDNGYGNFEYAPPSGYLALCTQNLATELSPTIDDGSAYFQTALWTGTGSSQTITNDGNSDLQPDFVWIKCRSVSRDHVLLDSTRGGTKVLSSNSSSVEATDGAITSFNTDGFTHSGQNAYGGNGETHVGWQWKANGGTTSSNTDGSITSTVQANTTAGFSIVTWTGTEANATVGHGLGKRPECIIVKTRGGDENWVVRFRDTITGNAFHKLHLNNTNTIAQDYTLGNMQDTTSSVFYLQNSGQENDSGQPMIAYCFAPIEGYSKFGSYTGNGSTDGTFVYTGFRPAWIMFKNTEQAGGQWFIHDNKRETFNPSNSSLFAESSQAETANNSALDIDFLSNGFKKRNTGSGANNSGIKYIYMAFGHTFVDSNGVPNTAR